MTTILFPTRGGEASYANQDRVIGLAREEEARLIFMYVSDVRFISMTALPVLVDIEEELEEMGEFLMAMAQERAAKQGVEAEIMVRRGVFRQALKDVIREQQVDVVVLGSSSETTGVTTKSYRRELIVELVEETGVEVLVLNNGEVADRYDPGNIRQDH
ncbi:MAG TPA: universal stress protein [Candidatus Sulfomarinibacteraceae bacterium]|nr:universal stress protein [Candidatus Sulfomarinibacteraceae bacterium]